MKSVAHSMNQSDMVSDTIETFGVKKDDKKSSPLTKQKKQKKKEVKKGTNFLDDSPFEYDVPEEEEEDDVVELDEPEQEPELIDDSNVKTARR